MDNEDDGEHKDDHNHQQKDTNDSKELKPTSSNISSEEAFFKDLKRKIKENEKNFKNLNALIVNLNITGVHTEINKIYDELRNKTSVSETIKICENIGKFSNLNR